MAASSAAALPAAVPAAGAGVAAGDAGAVDARGAADAAGAIGAAGAAEPGAEPETPRMHMHRIAAPAIRPAPRRAPAFPIMVVVSSASGSAGAAGAGLELRDWRRGPGTGEAGQRQLGTWEAAAEDQVGGVLAERRPQLEAVARAAAEQPDVAGLGMAVDQQLAVQGALVLADAALEQRSAGHPGEPPGEVAAGAIEIRRGRQPLAAGGIESLATAVVGDLEAPVVVAGDAVEDAFAVIHPHRQRGFAVGRAAAGRSAEVEDLLAGDAQPLPQDLGEEPSHPGAAGEDVAVGAQAAAVRQRQGCHLPAPGAPLPVHDRAGCRGDLAHLAAGSGDRPGDHPAGTARRQVARPLLVEHAV